MTLSAGTGFNAVGREIFGFAPQIDFSAGSSGDDRTAFDFTSPTQLYMCELQPGINTSGMAISISFIAIPEVLMPGCSSHM